MAVPRRVELGGNRGKPRPDVICQHLAAALAEAIHLPCTLQKSGRTVDGVWVQGAAGAVQRLDGRIVGVGAKGLGVHAGLQLQRDRQGRGRRLGQRDLHFIVPIKPQRAAESENRSLRHAAGLRQRRDGQVLCVLCVLQ